METWAFAAPRRSQFMQQWLKLFDMAISAGRQNGFRWWMGGGEVGQTEPDEYYDWWFIAPDGPHYIIWRLTNKWAPKAGVRSQWENKSASVSSTWFDQPTDITEVDDINDDIVDYLHYPLFIYLDYTVPCDYQHYIQVVRTMLEGRVSLNFDRGVLSFSLPLAPPCPYATRATRPHFRTSTRANGGLPA